MGFMSKRFSVLLMTVSVGASVFLLYNQAQTNRTGN